MLLLQYGANGSCYWTQNYSWFNIMCMKQDIQYDVILYSTMVKLKYLDRGVQGVMETFRSLIIGALLDRFRLDGQSTSILTIGPSLTDIARLQQKSPTAVSEANERWEVVRLWRRLAETYCATVIGLTRRNCDCLGTVRWCISAAATAIAITTATAWAAGPGPVRCGPRSVRRNRPYREAMGRDARSPVSGLWPLLLLLCWQWQHQRVRCNRCSRWWVPRKTWW